MSLANDRTTSSLDVPVNSEQETSPSMQVGSVLLRHLTANDDVLESDPIPIFASDGPFATAMLVDSAAFGGLSIGIHPSFESTDLHQTSPRIELSLRRHGLRGYGLDYLRRFWETVADKMAHQCATLLAQSIETAIEDLGSRED